MTQEQMERFLSELGRLHQRYELSKTVTPDYFEPGMMEYLDQSEGLFDEQKGEALLRFESKGTRYDGRTELIESIRVGEEIQILRDKENPYNYNNFTMQTAKGRNIGNMPAPLCNVIAPLYDSGDLVFTAARVSYADPISKRSRHAKQAMLFVELRCRLTGEISDDTSGG